MIVSLIFAGDGANGQGDSLCKKDAEGGGGPTRGKQQHTLDPSVSQHGCGSILRLGNVFHAESDSVYSCVAKNAAEC